MAQNGKKVDQKRHSNAKKSSKKHIFKIGLKTYLFSSKRMAPSLRFLYDMFPFTHHQIKSNGFFSFDNSLSPFEICAESNQH